MAIFSIGTDAAGIVALDCAWVAAWGPLPVWEAIPLEVVLLDMISLPECKVMGSTTLGFPPIFHKNGGFVARMVSENQLFFFRRAAGEQIPASPQVRYSEPAGLPRRFGVPHLRAL